MVVERSEEERTENPGVTESANTGNPGLFADFPKKVPSDFYPGNHGRAMDAMLQREDLILLALNKIWDTVQREKPRRTTRRTAATEADRRIELLFPPSDFPTHTEGIYGAALDTIQGRQELMAHAIQKIFEAVIPEDPKGKQTRRKKGAFESEEEENEGDGKRQKIGDTEEELVPISTMIPEGFFEILKGISKVFVESGQQMPNDKSPKASAWAITWRQFVMEHVSWKEREKLCKLTDKQWDDLYLKCSKELPEPKGKEKARPSPAENTTDRGTPRVKKGIARRVIRRNKSHLSEEIPRVADQRVEAERRNTGEETNQPSAQVSSLKKKEMTRRNTEDGTGQASNQISDLEKRERIRRSTEDRINHPTDQVSNPEKQMSRRNTGDGRDISHERGLDLRQNEEEAHSNQLSGESKSQLKDSTVGRKKRDAEAKKKLGIS